MSYFLLALLAGAVTGVVWVLIVEVRHGFRDAEFRSAIRILIAPFRSVGESLDQIWNSSVVTVQTVLWPKKKEGRT